MADFLADVRFGARMLRRSPVFAVAAVLLIAIGITASTLIFSVVDAVILRPLPLRNAAALVRIVEVHPTGFVTWELPRLMYERIAAQGRSLTDVVCQGDVDVALTEGGVTDRVRVNVVSLNFFEALGIRAKLGRVLTAADEKASVMPAVLSYDAWQRRFGGNPAILGRTIRLHGRPFVVVGVLPEGMNGLTVDTSPDVRVPLTASRLLLDASPEADYRSYVQVFAHLRPGASARQAEAENAALLHETDKEVLAHSDLPAPVQKDALESRFQFESVSNGVSTLRPQFSSALTVLMCAVVLLLMMACANVAGLLLARSAARSQEIAVRRALGASASRIVRQLLTESLLLGAIGGAAGVLLTWICVPLLRSALPPIRDRAAVLQPLAIDISLGGRVLVFAVAATVTAVILAGLSPALRASRGESLAGTRTWSRRASLRRIIVVVQVAICMLLVLGAGVLIQSLDHIRSMNIGFDRNRVVTFTIDPQLRGYQPQQANKFSIALLEKTRNLPTVQAASIASRGLMRGTGLKGTFGAAGAPITRNDFLNASINSVTPGYFATMGMRIVAGRDFQPSDATAAKPLKVIVNEKFARRFFPGEDPIGKKFGSKGADGLATATDEIIGVVTDAKYRSLREETPPTVYNPELDGFDWTFILHVRTEQDPKTLIAPVREAMRSLDPEVPIVETRTLQEEVETSLWQERLVAALAGIFAFTAGVLAAVGIYGTLDYAVKGRTREIGIRIAVGAAPRRIMQLLLSETAVLVLGGAAIGVAAYSIAVRWIRQLLFGVAPLDALAVECAIGIVAAITAVAVAAPIWRAMLIDAASALRQE